MERSKLQYGVLIDEATFEQILEMDDDDSRSFSKPLVTDFFVQAGNTFKEIQAAIDTKDLYTLHQLGHFLKGSSATLGLINVRKRCEAIQTLGLAAGEAKPPPEERDKRVAQIQVELRHAEQEFDTVKNILTEFFGIE